MARTSPASELRDLSDDELVTRLVETKDELFKLRFRHVTGQLENSSRLSLLRKDVARLNTVLRQREIAAAEALENQNNG